MTHERKIQKLEKKIEQLTQSREQYAEIFHMSMDLICIADINTARFIKINPAFARTLGYTEKELLNRTFFEFIHPDDIESTRDAVENKLKAGKEIIKDIIHTINARHLLKQIVFIEDYDMNVARYMVQGVDVWLNNPLRPHEASGTSGMKAAVNGGLNLSILDGWWDEAYDNLNGWAIGSRESYSDRTYQDEVESRAIYSIIENDIVPMFYESITDGIPREWIKMMKHAFVSISSFFNTGRMLEEYCEKFYSEAGKNFNLLSQDEFKQAKELVDWKNNIRDQFGSISIGAVNFEKKKIYKTNDRIKIDVEVSTGSLKPEDIRVDIYYGKYTGEQDLSSTAIEQLTQDTPQGDGKYLFSGELTCTKSGNFGFKVRITPHHPLTTNPYEMNLVLWK